MPYFIPGLTDIRNKILYVSCYVDTSTRQYLDMIDAFQWADMVMAKFPDDFLATGLPHELIQLKKDIIRAKKVGNFLVQFDQGNTKKYGHAGISIFFPANQDVCTLSDIPWCAYFGGKIASDWQRRWMSFLDKYYQAR
jgi:hypothetical protein